ncbi:MAG: hypothetical protein IT372_37945 [Polyangiaceae bacterium]|nr:hypothetical protein [Polyangiaceae bacterium]
MSSKHPTPNDQRSTVKNPNSDAYRDDRANRIAQGHFDPSPPPALRAPAAQQPPAQQVRKK